MTHKILHSNSLKQTFFILYVVTGKIRKKNPRAEAETCRPCVTQSNQSESSALALSAC